VVSFVPLPNTPFSLNPMRCVNRADDSVEWKRHQQILRKLDSQSQELMLRFVQKGGPPYIT
jgi:hypothetical protein